MNHDPIYIYQEHAYSGIQVSTAWRLDREWGGDLYYKKHDLLTKDFYFLLYRRRYFLFCFWIDVVCVLATTKNISAVAAYTRVIC